MRKSCKHATQVVVATTIALTSTVVCLRAEANPPIALEGHDEYIYMISFSGDGKVMATAAGDNKAIVWNFPKREPLHTLEHDAAVYAAALSPDGKVVATGTGERKLSLWRVRDGQRFKHQVAHADALYCVDYTHNGRQLASAGGSTDGGDTTCRLWSKNDLTKLSEFAGHERQIYGLAFSPDDKLLATGSSDKTIRIWNLERGDCTQLNGHTSDVYRIAFSPDQQQLASVSQDGSVRIWNLKTGEAMVIHDGGKSKPMYAVAFDSHGKTMVAVGDDGRLRTWRTEDWQLVNESRISKLPLYAVAFSPGEPFAVTAGEDGKVYLIEREISADASARDP